MKEKRIKITLKKGKKGLNASFWAYLFVGKEMNFKRGGGEIIKMHNIYPCLVV